MSATALRYLVEGTDCATCAKKVEAAARHVAGVTAARVSTTTQVLEIEGEGPWLRESPGS